MRKGCDIAKRRNFTDQFKAKLTLEALRGNKSIQKIVAKHQLHPIQVSTWKHLAVEGMSKYGPPEIMNTNQDRPFTGTNEITPLTEANIRVSMDGRRRYLDNIFTARRLPSAAAHSRIDRFLQFEEASFGP